MKRSIAFLLALILSIALLAGCGGEKNERTPAPDTTPDTPTESPHTTPDTQSEPPEVTGTFITVDEARVILRAWLVSHPFQFSSVLEPESDEYIVGGAEYYRFYIGIERFGIAEVLVHKETGGLFHFASPGSAAFEPLDDRYSHST